MRGAGAPKPVAIGSGDVPPIIVWLLDDAGVGEEVRGAGAPKLVAIGNGDVAPSMVWLCAGARTSGDAEPLIVDGPCGPVGSSGRLIIARSSAGARTSGEPVIVDGPCGPVGSAGTSGAELVVDGPCGPGERCAMADGAPRSVSGSAGIGGLCSGALGVRDPAPSPPVGVIRG